MSTEDSEKIGILTERIESLIERFDRFEEATQTRFVERTEFSPVQKLVYGGVGIVMTAVLTAVLGLVVLHR